MCPMLFYMLHSFASAEMSNTSFVDCFSFPLLAVKKLMMFSVEAMFVTIENLNSRRKLDAEVILEDPFVSMDSIL